MINFNFQKDCYHCSACVQQCPVGAISMSADLLPEVNSGMCIRCGRCETVCLHLSPPERVAPLAGEAFLAKNLDTELRKRSSSGGMFYPLAMQVLSENGAVCGCIWDDAFLPKHIVSSKEEDVRKMLGSKYIQSDMGDCIRQMEQLLKRGQKVLFSGVPCQTEAVARSLRAYRSQLLLVALICHGSVDRSLWSRFLAQESDPEKTLTGITMRDKSRGWSNYGLKLSYSDGTSQTTFRNEDGYFLNCFTNGIFERDRCLSCRYKGGVISADIVLGDGWGAECLAPSFADSLGSSYVLCLTESGQRAIEQISSQIETLPISLDDIVHNNQRIATPAPDSLDRHHFLRRYRVHPENLSALCREFSRESFLSRAFRKLSKLLH